MSTVTVTVEVELDPDISPQTWTDLSADVVGDLEISYGIAGQGPTDNTSGTGVCQFQLANYDPVGRYSPGHPSVLAGWTLGRRVRVTLDDGTNSAVKHHGRVRRIVPTTGVNRERLVDVECTDVVADFADTDVRELDILLDQQEDDLLTEVVSALPAASQPVATSYDAGVDTFPVAFHDVKKGQKALQLMHDIATSAFALIVVTGPGTLRLISRANRAAGTMQYGFADTELTDLDVPVDMSNVYNQVRVTVHPTTIDAAATTTLWEPASDDPVEVPGSGSITFWAEYRDPNNPQTTLIGGTEIVTPVATTHYQANTAADGSGTDITSDQTVTYTVFASTVKIQLDNANAGTAYYVDSSGNNFLKVVGKGIYDQSTETYETVQAQPYGQQPIAIDMRYQRSAAIAQAYADNVSTQWQDFTAQVDRVSFQANVSDALMEQAIDREPGDRIQVSETVTGIEDLDLIIAGITLRASPGGLLEVEYRTSPAALPFDSWLLGVTGRGELGTNTKLGF